MKVTIILYYTNLYIELYNNYYLIYFRIAYPF